MQKQINDFIITFKGLWHFKPWLQIAKLHLYNFQHDAWKLLHSYLSKQWYRTTRYFYKSTRLLPHGRNWLKVIPRICFRTTILFNLYLNDLIHLDDFTEVCNFPDYTKFHFCDNDLNNLIKRLEYDTFFVTFFTCDTYYILFHEILYMK